MTYFVVSHVSHAWDRNTSYLKYLTVSQMYSKPASQKRKTAAAPQSEEAQGSGRPSRATKATPKARESKSTGRKSKRARA